ncbi:MAG: ABC transporter substrate-binding protein [Syntrophobacteraceae bacterium]
MIKTCGVMLKLMFLFPAIIGAVSGAGAQTKTGPVADRVIFESRMDQTVAQKDVIEGKSDVCFTPFDGRTFMGLSSSEKAKLDIFAVPSGSWSLYVNPVPNRPPYTLTAKDGRAVFNPFAIREIRFALNWLIDRRLIVDEILMGDGKPMFTPMPSGQPGTFRYNLIPLKLSMTETGNEAKALSEIDAAMNAAADLPENKGKLTKIGRWWSFNGEPVSIRFVIRVDDPTGRLLLGCYVADRIEKAGIKVERLEYDRVKSVRLVYSGNPADNEWNLYTEAWAAGGTSAWWDGSISQMYAPYFGQMPGGSTGGFWNYENRELDDLAQRVSNGWFMTSDEYWRDCLKATELGLHEAVRIYVASQLQYYIANKSRFNGKMVYGLGDGLNRWSLITGDVKPNAQNERIIRVIQYSAQGALFMKPWNPLGVEGFGDLYSVNVVDPCSDGTSFDTPNSGRVAMLRATWDLGEVRTKIAPAGEGDGKPQGLVPVPANALIYNSKSKRWESGIEYKQVGTKYDYVENNSITSYSSASAAYLYGNWHSGVPIVKADIMYGMAFQYEWANEDGKDDKYYNAAFAARSRPGLLTTKGLVVTEGGFTSYFDFNWPMEPDRVAAGGAVSPKAGNPGRNTVMPWEIYEALVLMITEGSRSGTAYSFSTERSKIEVDVIKAQCVADIRAKLEEMLEKRYVPGSIAGYCTADEAAFRYKVSIAFIDRYGHAYISNGPFFISKVDTNAKYIELSAFRDGSYPYASDYWPNRFRTGLTRIECVKPALTEKGRDTRVEINVSGVDYPSNVTKPADAGAQVSLTLLTEAEKVYRGVFVKPGVFEVSIPSKDISDLKAGGYVIVTESRYGDELPSFSFDKLIVIPF